MQVLINEKWQPIPKRPSKNTGCRGSNGGTEYVAEMQGAIRFDSATPCSCQLCRCKKNYEQLQHEERMTIRSMQHGGSRVQPSPEHADAQRQP